MTVLPAGSAIGQHNVFFTRYINYSVQMYTSFPLLLVLPVLGGGLVFSVFYSLFFV